MKGLRLSLVLGLIVLSFCDGLAQMPKKEIISHYKYVFIYNCTQRFEIDTGYRDEICAYFPIGVDKKSRLEIDSMATKIEQLIWSETKELACHPIDEHGPFPGRDCVLKYCMVQTESKSLNRLAKGFAKRMKKIEPWNYHFY